MEFIETPTFTRQITELLSADSYLAFQNDLMQNPVKGDVIVGGGGIRKVRWNLQGRGRSGSIRIIYYYKVVNDRVYLLLAYKKSKKTTLSDVETKILKALAKEIENER